MCVEKFNFQNVCMGLVKCLKSFPFVFPGQAELLQTVNRCINPAYSAEL